MQKRTGLLVLIALTALHGPTLAAEHSGSLEDQLACTPDVYRLCSKFIPDEDTIVGCLKQNVATLSPACRKVFTQPQTAKPSPDEED